ncbi:MAG: hypothetical protein AB7K37_14945 [Cyclobacteriaceae bacterium]
MNSFWRWLVGRLTTSRCKYQVGDSVQLRSRGNEHLMIVIEVMGNHKMEEPLVHCQWYESETRETRKNIFPESALMPFDWVEASRRREKQFSNSAKG